MIPKVIHYCWISGDPFPPVIEQCIQSWKEKLPDYEWVLWDRKKAEEIDNLWLHQCLAHRKYAFAADYLRLYALCHQGGIYLDVDVEVVRDFESLLQQSMFIGLDYNGYFEPAIIGSVPNHPWIKNLLDYYQNRTFILANKQLDLRPLPDILNESGQRLFGFQPSDQIEQIKDYQITIYPYDYFSPKSEYFKKIATTLNTYTIHHFEGSWVNRDFSYQLKRRLHQLIFRIGGREFHRQTIQCIRKCRI